MFALQSKDFIKGDLLAHLYSTGEQVGMLFLFVCFCFLFGKWWKRVWRGVPGGEESWGWWSNPGSFDLGVSACHLRGTVSYPLSLFSHLIHGSVVTAWTWFCLVWWSQKVALCSSCTAGHLVIRQSSTRQQTITQHAHYATGRHVTTTMLVWKGPNLEASSLKPSV